MSLAELLPGVQSLTRDDKLRLMEVLATELTDAYSGLTISGALDPDFDLATEQRASRDSGIERGDSDFAAGRFRSLEDVKADKRSRFGLFESRQLA